MLVLSITSCGRREVDSKEVAEEHNEPNQMSLRKAMKDSW